MKFGKQIKRLADPAHLNHYLAYDVLKKAIQVVVPTEVGSDVSMQPAESRFYELLQHEMSKVNRYFQLQLRTLLDKFREAQRALQRVSQGQGESLPRASHLLEEAADGLVELEKFRHLNVTGFRKIAKKFDKAMKSGVTLSSWFMPQLKRAFFVAHPLDGLLLSLSLGYAAARRFQGPAPEASMEIRRRPPTTTFWLAPTGRMRSLCTLVKSFQLRLPPQQGHVNVASEMSGEELCSELQKLLYALGTEGLAVPCRIAAQMTAEYFDSPQDGFPFYQNHVKAAASQGSVVGFRCRQTGARGDLVEMHGAGSSLGVHAFTPVQLGSPDAFALEGSGSSLERLRPSAEATASRAQAKDPGLVSAFGEEGCRQLADFASQVAGAAASYRLETVATIGAARLLLCGDTEQTRDVHLAVDEEVQFARELRAEVSDAVDFPYCLLEVSGENLGAAAWLEELRRCAALREVPAFDVGVQAVAALRKEDVPSLPHWYGFLSDESFAPPEEYGLALQLRADAGDEVRERASSGGALSVQAPEGAASAEEEKMLEPKNLLASERTMLEWMHTVFALALLAVGLWRYSLQLPPERSSQLLGIYSLFLVAVALAFAWYAVLSHIQRIRALARNELKERIFNRRLGPIVFAGCMTLALVSHLAMQLA